MIKTPNNPSFTSRAKVDDDVIIVSSPQLDKTSASEGNPKSERINSITNACQVKSLFSQTKKAGEKNSNKLQTDTSRIRSQNQENELNTNENELKTNSHESNNEVSSNAKDVCPENDKNKNKTNKPTKDDPQKNNRPIFRARTDRIPRRDNDNIFVGVSRRNVTQFYIGNIDESSTYSGLCSFLTDENHLHPTAVRLFQTKSGKRAARINLPNNEAEYVMNDEVVWPEGIVVKKWLTRRELRQQYEEKKQRQKYKSSHTSYRNNRRYENYEYDFENPDYDDYDYEANEQDYYNSYDTEYAQNKHSDYRAGPSRSSYID